MPSFMRSCRRRSYRRWGNLGWWGSGWPPAAGVGVCRYCWVLWVYPDSSQWPLRPPIPAARTHALRPSVNHQHPQPTGTAAGAAASGVSIDAALQGLLPPGPTAVEDRLKGRTVLLDNTRAQTEQQRQEVRARRRLLRGRVRLAAKAVPEEGDRATMRTGRGAFADYAGLHAAWRAYMTRLLGLRSSGGGDDEGGDGEGVSDEDGDDDDSSSNMAVDAPSAAAQHSRPSTPSAAAAAFPSQAAANSSTNSEAVAFSSLTGPLAVERRVLAADLHGCLLRVVASQSPDDVGIEGLVVRESATAFHLITRRDHRVRVLPKAGRRFAFDLGGRTFALHGHGLVRRAERVLASPLAGKAGSAVSAAAVDRRLLRTTKLG